MTIRKIGTLLVMSVSYLRRGHATLLCVVPTVTDNPRQESNIYKFAVCHTTSSRQTNPIKPLSDPRFVELSAPNNKESNRITHVGAFACY